MSVKPFRQSRASQLSFTGIPSGYLTTANVTSTVGSPTTATYTDALGTWRYYRWTGSGAITFNASGNIDVFLVGGGGGGGRSQASGGGAGGYCSLTMSVFASTHSVVVGAGGSYNTTAGNGFNGGDSYIGFIRALYGGGGGGGSNLAGNSGGSAGGSAINNGTSVGTLISPQGSSGGGNGGGGGGATQNGATGNGSTGKGGDGIGSSITGTLTYYAGGGGGEYGSLQTGGLGGGGAKDVNGTANTGGGGGAQFGSGGSGVVILRLRA